MGDKCSQAHTGGTLQMIGALRGWDGVVGSGYTRMPGGLCGGGTWVRI